MITQCSFLSLSTRVVIILISIIVAISAQGSDDITVYNVTCYTIVILLSLFVVISAIFESDIPLMLIRSILLFFLFTLISLVSFYFSEVAVSRFLAVYFNYFIFFVGSLFGMIICSHADDKLLINWFLIAAIVNTFYVFFKFWMSGGDILTARYHIVGSLMPVIFLPIMCKFLIDPVSARRDMPLGFFYYIILIFALVILVISKTRTLFFGIIGSALLVSILINRKLPFNKDVFKLFCAVFFVLLPVLWFAGFLESFNDFVERFTLIGTEDDITSYTRMAEYSYQMKFMLSSLTRIIFGSGLGQHFYYDDKYYYAMQQVFTIEKYNEQGGDTFGHSLYVYTLFSSGIMISIYFLYKIVWFVLHVFNNGRTINRVVLDAMLCMMFFLLIIFGFFMSPLGARESAYFFGVVVGCLSIRSYKWKVS